MIKELKVCPVCMKEHNNTKFCSYRCRTIDTNRRYNFNKLNELQIKIIIRAYYDLNVPMKDIQAYYNVSYNTVRFHIQKGKNG